MTSLEENIKKFLQKTDGIGKDLFNCLIGEGKRLSKTEDEIIDYLKDLNPQMNEREIKEMLELGTKLQIIHYGNPKFYDGKLDITRRLTKGGYRLISK